MLYPIDVQSFEDMIMRHYIYVDKTDLVYKLAQSHICFLSRPRRFGKSLLVSTLEAYFSGRKELFNGLKIEALEKDWIKYPVFHMNFAGGNYNHPGELINKIENFLGIWEKIYEREEYHRTLSDCFQNIIEKAHKQTGYKAVV